MQVTVTITADSETDSAKIAHALQVLTGSAELVSSKVETTAKPEEKPKTTRTRRTKAQIAADKKKEEEAKKAKDEADLFGEESGEAVSLDDVKSATRASVDTRGVDGTQAIFKKYGAEKLSEIKEKDYAAVVADLKAEE